MSGKRCVAGVLAGVVCLSAVAGADDQMQARISALEAKIAALEAKQESHAPDLAATIDAVLRDAERRSALLASGSDMGAGYDNGFFIRAGDGASGVRLRVMIAS